MVHYNQQCIKNVQSKQKQVAYQEKKNSQWIDPVHIGHVYPLTSQSEIIFASLSTC